MKQVYLAIAVFILLTVSRALACTLSWNAVTTYTTGAVITGVVTYKVYFTPVGSSTVQTVATTTVLTATLVCPAGVYSVTATAPLVLESALSTSVVLNQASAPVNLQWVP
jgi:hypothetical protein